MEDFLKNTLIITTNDKLKIIIESSEAAKVFSDDENKRECFCNFTKENQIKWCESNLNKENIANLENVKIV